MMASVFTMDLVLPSGPRDEEVGVAFCYWKQ